MLPDLEDWAVVGVLLGMLQPEAEHVMLNLTITRHDTGYSARWYVRDSHRADWAHGETLGETVARILLAVWGPA